MNAEFTCKKTGDRRPPEPRLWYAFATLKSSDTHSLRRTQAWCRIIDAVATQREALDQRAWREDPADVHLPADVQTWCERTQALTDFLKARRSV